MKPFTPTLLAALCLAATPAHSHAADTAEVGDFAFEIDAPWTKGEPSSGMVKAVAEIKPEGATEALAASFYYFGPGQGGSTEANVNRWIGQFEGEPEVSMERLKFGEVRVTVLEVSGTYLSGPPFGAKTPVPDQLLFGAIIEGESAPVFIKMTGPGKEMASAREAFKDLVGSAFGDVEPETIGEDG